MSESYYTPTESALIAASIGTGPFLSAREAQESIARIKAEAWDACASRARGDAERELLNANPYREEAT